MVLGRPRGGHYRRDPQEPTLLGGDAEVSSDYGGDAQGRTVLGAETGRGSMSNPSQSGSHTIRPGSLAVAWALFLPDRLASALPSQCSGVGQCGFRSPTWGLSTFPRSRDQRPGVNSRAAPVRYF